MKKLLALLPIILILATTYQPAAAQQKVDYDQCLFVNPFGLIFGLVYVGYEQQITNNNSILIRGYYWTLFEDWAAYGIGASYRWYFDAFKQGVTPIQGLGVGPMIALNYWSWTGSDYWNYDGGVDIVLGGEAVYKWVWGGFALEPGITLGVHLTDIEGRGNISPFGGQVSIGYAW